MIPETDEFLVTVATTKDESDRLGAASVCRNEWETAPSNHRRFGFGIDEVFRSETIAPNDGEFGDDRDLQQGCVCDRVADALSQSRYPLRQVHCSCDERSLRLHGQVKRYYHLQMVIEIARLLADGRRIEMQIKVVTPIDDIPSVE